MAHDAAVGAVEHRAPFIPRPGGQPARDLGAELDRIAVLRIRVQADRVGTVRRLSQQFGGCWVVLKGHQTTIGTMQGDVFVNGSGCPALAQGGSGDVLSGFIAGWLAQPLLRTDAPLAIRYAVWEHGAAADRLEQRQPNWTIEELATELGRVPALRC